MYYAFFGDRDESDLRGSQPVKGEYANRILKNLSKRLKKLERYITQLKEIQKQYNWSWVDFALAHHQDSYNALRRNYLRNHFTINNLALSDMSEALDALQADLSEAMENLTEESSSVKSGLGFSGQQNAFFHYMLPNENHVLARENGQHCDGETCALNM